MSLPYENTTDAINERPILFKSEMVRAILEGRKTQTRRVVKGLALDWVEQYGFTPEFVVNPENSLCPHGQPGDRLWVRETFSGPYCMDEIDGLPAMPPRQWSIETPIWYWADGEPTYGDWTKPKPSIHLPRWASRIALEITGVRVERLQGISYADAQAEGVQTETADPWFYHISTERNVYDFAADEPQGSFRKLWESINGPGSWKENPWVWVIEFKRVQP
jgi:hypothetical protein